MKRTSHWNNIEDGDCYQARKLTSSERDQSALLSGALFHRNEFLLNNCAALKNQQQQQDNTYVLTFLMSSFSPALCPTYFGIPRGISTCV